LSRSRLVDPNSGGVIVETGCGASTIVLSYFAFKYRKQLYTWDTNQNKLAYIRSIILDTHQRVFGESLHNHWVYVPYISTSRELGIPILAEKQKRIDFGFFDSEHTAENLIGEIDCAIALSDDGTIFALDDANYDYSYRNIAYINVMRKKLDLPEIQNPEDNVTKPFYSLVEERVRVDFPGTLKLEDSYKKAFKEDIFFSYFANDRAIMDKLNMEKLSELEHRYDSYLLAR
jgi:hypothetical protein